MNTDEPEKKHLIIFIALFLAVIYSVPLVQTAVEFFTNERHRIQLADLVVDLFVTPLRKKNVDRATIDSVSVSLANLHDAVRRYSDDAAAGDTVGDVFTLVIDRADMALVHVRGLKQSVADYNRHIAGEKNRFAASDTVKSYFRALRECETLLDNTIIAARAEAPFDSLLHHIASAQDAATAALNHSGSRNAIVAYPALTLTAMRRILVGADYLRPYEKEMENNSLFANAVRPWMRMAFYLAFGDPGEKALRGKQGWLFYRPDVEYLTKPDIDDIHSIIVDPNDAPIRDAVLDTIVSFRNQLASRGIDLVVVIMPGKPSIYPDLLAPAMPPGSAGAFSHSTAFIDKLSKAGVATVDLFSAFAAERRNDGAAGDSLYLRTDTHFRGRAAKIAARTVADRLRKYAWFAPGSVEYGIDTLTVARHGDIVEMLKLPAVKIPAIGLPFPAEPTTCYRVVRIQRDATGAAIEKIPYRDDYRGADILVLGDSFSRIYQTDEPRSAGWISHLAYEIKRPVASLVNDGGASTLVRQTLARKTNLLKGKKAVVWEIVERDLRFGADGWKDIRLVGE